MATLQPFSRSYEWLVNHCNWLLAAAWVAGAVYSSGTLPHVGVVRFGHGNASYADCRIDLGLSAAKQQLYSSANFLLTFLLPLVVLAVAYGSISGKLLNDALAANDGPLRRSATTDRSRVSHSFYHKYYKCMHLSRHLSPIAENISKVMNSFEFPKSQM